MMEDLKSMNDQQLLDKLAAMGIANIREELSENIAKYYSSKKFCKDLIKRKELTLSKEDTSVANFAIAELWYRWYPDIPFFEIVDDKMQMGYELAFEDEKEGCDLWWTTWKDIVYLMDKLGLKDTDEFDDKFGGMQSVFNWSTDFLAELENARRDDDKYGQMSIDFFTEYLARSKYTENNTMNMKRSMAAAYIGLGRIEEGDALFETYVKEEPQDAFIWLEWHHSYHHFGNAKYKDKNKAESILKRALEVPDLQDREEVLRCLKEFYIDCKQPDKAAGITKEMNLLKKAQQVPKTPVVEPGRNDPCPCGSGKKYKKCCGS